MSFLQHGLSEDSSYTVNQSLRFRAGNSAYLSRTFGATPTSNNKQTFSIWLKRGVLGAVQIIQAGYDGSSASACYFYFQSDGSFAVDLGGAASNLQVTTALFRDASAWYHIVVGLDTSNTTASNRLSVEINGQPYTLSGTTVQNSGQFLRANSYNKIGCNHNNTVYFYDGYQAEYIAVDGQKLSASNFGQIDPATGIWVPKKYTGTYGTNGFYLPFNDATSLTTLGYDRSGNGNNWTCNGISITAGATYDVMKDSPINSGDKGNYATLNLLYPSHSTLTNGNLTASGATDLPTIIPDSGTWYFEIDGVSKTWTPPAAFPAAAGNYNFGQRPFTNTPTYPTLHTGNLSGATPVTTSGTFTGNASTDGPCIFINGTPTAMTINGNAVTFATHADKLAGGFKVRSSSASYNTAGTNTYSITTNSGKFKNARAQANP